MDRVRIGSYYFFIFLSDPNPIYLNLGQKILTHAQPDLTRLVQDN
jgi:hypothetical protein